MIIYLVIDKLYLVHSSSGEAKNQKEGNEMSKHGPEIDRIVGSVFQTAVNNGWDPSREEFSDFFSRTSIEDKVRRHEPISETDRRLSYHHYLREVNMRLR